MFKIIALIIVMLAAAVLIYATTKPDTFSVQRSTNIKASPERIFPMINDFHGWVNWSPWEKMDSTLKRTYSGSAQGQGAVYEWDGNNQVGTGRMEIVEAAPPSKVLIKLDVIKPFEGHNIAKFTLEDKGDSTNITWAMYGTTPYPAKVMHVFFSMDSMVGPQFETGLANMKALTEK
jgi:uncharacterized protein YndB with AHSA1/START domain